MTTATPLKPASVVDVQAAVKSAEKILPIGAGTKPALTAVSPKVTMLDMRGLSGIVAYDAGEYTFTAKAGTPISMVAAALAENGQYLPFDPLFSAEGATLGGTIAANTGGSGRLRYGGVRDFIIGIRWVDGRGELLRGGGAVVKNAAGFDTPKFFVGSCGRFGILTEVTFKVFPQPAAYITMRATMASVKDGVDLLHHIGRSPLEFDAVDLSFEAGRWVVTIRLGGLPSALTQRRLRLANWLATVAATAEISVDEQDSEYWQTQNALVDLAHQPVHIQLPIVPRLIPGVVSALPGATWRFMAGGHLAWCGAEDVAAVDDVLRRHALSGLVRRGEHTGPLVGAPPAKLLLRRVKLAHDPNNKFVEL